MSDLDLVERRTDEELAREARDGSLRSFDALARRYKRRLFVYLRARLGSDEDAEDMVQETFLKLYRNIRSYDPAFRFSTWLYTSASRLAISSYRKKRIEAVRLEAEAMDARSAAGADRMTRETVAEGLWDAARTLGASQFGALWLRYGEDMTTEEIARAMGRSRLAVRILLHRARMNLSRRVGPEKRSATALRPRTAGEAAKE